VYAYCWHTTDTFGSGNVAQALAPILYASWSFRFFRRRRTAVVPRIHHRSARLVGTTTNMNLAHSPKFRNLLRRSSRSPVSTDINVTPTKTPPTPTTPIKPPPPGKGYRKFVTCLLTDFSFFFFGKDADAADILLGPRSSPSPGTVASSGPSTTTTTTTTGVVVDVPRLQRVGRQNSKLGAFEMAITVLSEAANLALSVPYLGAVAGILVQIIRIKGVRCFLTFIILVLFLLSSFFFFLLLVLIYLFYGQWLMEDFG
jgi:hypothetical protein